MQSRPMKVAHRDLRNRLRLTDGKGDFHKAGWVKGRTPHGAAVRFHPRESRGRPVACA